MPTKTHAPKPRRAGAHRPPPDIHINLNVRGMSPSATLAIQEQCAALGEARKPVWRLGLGQSPFPVPRPVVEQLRANAHQKAYLPVKGLPELRTAVADYLARSQGIRCSHDDVLIGPGSKELMFLLQLVYYGELVIPSPAWVSYAPQARIVGRQVHWIQTRRDNGWRFSADDLRALCRTDPGRPRIVVLNYPNNPTGASYTPGELEEIADVARAHRIVVLSDEIYGELHHEGGHVSIAHFYPEGTIISSGLSKWCGAGGWRLGTFTFPASMRWLLDAMAAVASETYTSTSAPIQYAASRAFQGGIQIERYLWNCRRILKALGRWSAARLREVGARVDDPVGGFYLFPDFSEVLRPLRQRGMAGSAGMCDRLLADTGVAILPGVDFGRPPDELTARLAYVDFDGARALAALEVRPRDWQPDHAFLRARCGQTVEAIERLCDWVRGQGRSRTTAPRPTGRATRARA